MPLANVRHVILLFLALTLSAQAARLEPIDESAQDTSFQAFRKKLGVAITKQDKKFLRAILDPKVKYSFGDIEAKSPVEGFFKFYRIDEAKSEFWAQLKSVVELGCSRYEGSYTCPYVTAKFPQDLDSFDHIAVTQKGAPILTEPRKGAPQIRTTNYDILDIDWNKSTKEWHAVKLGDAKLGYIAKSAARSPIDHRARFEKNAAGQWILKFFIAGD